MKMETNHIEIDNHGKGIDEVLQAVWETAARLNLDRRSASHLRLLSEELMELVRNLAGEFNADFSMIVNGNDCEIRILANTQMDPEKRERILAAAKERTKSSTAISERMRQIMDGDFSYDEGKEIPDVIGIQKAKAGDIRDLDAPEIDKTEEGYVWSLQSYKLSAFDEEEEKGIDENWAEIGRSIIANLADDVRIYIFRNTIELIAEKRLDERKGNDKISIAPAFNSLKLVPVPKTPFQVWMVQLLYGGLANSERSSSKVKVKSLMIPVPSSPEGFLNALAYIPRCLNEESKTPCLLFLHGGAFVLPALPYHYRMARGFAEKAECVVIMPDYDIAPEHVPPLQQHEARDVYKYLLLNAESLKIDAARIAVAGDSAGGTMTAALCLLAKKEGFRMPAAQMLMYPSLDARLNSASMKKYTDVPVCNATSIKEYYKMCRWDEYEGDYFLASPVEAESLAGLPDAYVETAEFDSLHDDGIAYANRLRDEGCNVILNETKGTVHAFDMAKNSAICKNVMERRVEFLKQVLGS